MRIDEISDLDRTYLTIKGIQYNFAEDYDNIISVYPLTGKSINRRNILLSDIDFVCSNIELLLNQNFENNETDIDIINAKSIYSKLQDIKNKL